MYLSMEEILETRGLTKRYGNLVAVNEVDFTVREGEIVGLLGPNGAGKTSLVSMLAGILEPSGGQAFVAGMDIVRDSARVKQIVGFVPQDLAVYPELSGYQNLSFFASLYGLKGRECAERISDVLDIVQLSGWAGKKVRTYSGGMKRRLNLAVGLLNRPAVLLLDEPTVGVDPQSRNHIFESIKNLVRERKIAVIYTTHYMEEAEHLCDRVAIYVDGRITACDRPQDLVAKIGGQTITIGFDGELTEDILASLKGLPNVSNAVARMNSLELFADSAVDIVGTVVERVRTVVRPTSLHVSGASLETVFLALTGRSLRD